MNTQRKPLTPTQLRIVKAKASGVPQNEIGKEVYPNANPNSQQVLVSRELKRPDVQEELAKAFADNGITIDAAVKPVADGLTATRSVGIGDDAFEVADHSTRLKAAGMAFGLMGIGKQSGDVTINFINSSSEQGEVYDL